ncbi:MAG TPA: protease [Bacteroidales bacterium]|jgi:heat shock protein HtpX|nr:protease [Bacteroidales bacterium]
MKYVGLQTQIWRNNSKSVLLLILFPFVFFALSWLFYFFLLDKEVYDIQDVNYNWLQTIPWIAIGVAIWFFIAFFAHSKMIQKATGSRTLERRENKRVYNLVENLCISTGMKTPRINIIEDDSLNAFASGIDNRTYTVSLSRGIIDKLNDEELEGVIAHELTHIRNRDVRLLIVSIVFVGIFAFLSEMLMRTVVYGGGRSRGKKDGGNAVIIAFALALFGYLITSLFRFALSRKREYLADAGAAELTKKPQALASALRKVSSDAKIEAVERKDVAQLFIENPGEKKKKVAFASMFATHPPIARRIEILEQF